MTGAGASASSSSHVAAPVRFCAYKRHICGPCDVQRGCSSCTRSCHSDCTSELCDFDPCTYCVALSFVTHVNSALCQDVQRRNKGCHACGSLGCWIGNGSCHARCTATDHVCGPCIPGAGCSSCDKMCHRTNADQRCMYYRMARGHVTWSASVQDLLDTQAGTGGSVPHRFQLPWEFRDAARSCLAVDGVLYRRGYGNPGEAQLGERNNCLIDSLRQCLGNIACDRRRVRQDLMSEFGSDLSGDARRVVDLASYLDVEHHWRAILRSIFRHNTEGRPVDCNVDEYCVVALAGDRPGHGVVLGTRGAPNRLVIVNWSDVHFDPCLLL